MRNRRIVKILIFVIIMIAFSKCDSFAAIEIKDTTSVLTNKTISDFYEMAKEMKNPGQGLEGTNVDVKMANNYEWATVSYFSNSGYGTGGAGENAGVQIPNTTHYSTNGNLTGIMDWGKTYSFTAGIISDYASKTLTTEGNLSTDSTRSVIVDNAETDSIDKFSSSSDAQAIARNGWYSSWNNIGAYADYPYSFRQGLFGFAGGSNDVYWGVLDLEAGAARWDATFRAIFYAQ